MSTKDMIKKSVLELYEMGTGTTLTMTLNICIALIASLLLGIFIAYIYTKFFRGVVYSRSFATTLIGMTVLTCMVTLAISTNVVISLGMVGALSIVRYRTAIKEPIDLVYLFWAITAGITMGAGMYVLCVIASLIMVLLFTVEKRHSGSGQVYIVVMHYEGDFAGDNIRKAMGKINYRIKSKTLRDESAELAMEVFTKNQNMIFVENLRALTGVTDVTLIQYDGEYHE